MPADNAPPPRRLIPTGPLGPPETPAPPPGRFRAVVTPRHDPPEDPPGPDGLPTPPRSLWRGYGDTPDRYHHLAAEHVESMLLGLAAALKTPAHGSSVLDFGCAAGPMLRVIRTRRPDLVLWGCDIDPLAIDWCRRHLPGSLRLFTNTTAPHLPLPDGSFDLVYAGSVLTHILHVADAWLLELARILRPGGVLYATIHDRAFIANTIMHAPDWHFTRTIREHFGDDVLASDWDHLTLGAGPAANIFYDRDAFMRMASQAFDLALVRERAYGNQTALVLTRPA